MDNPNDERDSILDDLSEYNNELFHTEYLNRNIPRDEIPDRMDRVFDEYLDLIMYFYTVVHEHRDNYHYQQRIRRNYERNQHRRAQQATQGQPPAVEVVAPPFGLAYLAKPKVTALKKSDMKTILSDVCGICLEPPVRKDTILLNCCNKSFCKSCMDMYVGDALSKGTRPNRMVCPMCRHAGFKYTEFRERKTPVRKPKPVSPQDMGNLVDMMSNVVI